MVDMRRRKLQQERFKETWEKAPVLSNRKSEPQAPGKKGRASRAITAIGGLYREGKGLSGIE